MTTTASWLRRTAAQQKVKRLVQKGILQKPRASEASRRKVTDPSRIVDFEQAPTWRERGQEMHFHASQMAAWLSMATIVAICAGWQSGKTVVLPFWLRREIQRKGPGDYGAFTSTYPLLAKKLLPFMRKAFKGLADFHAGAMTFVLSEAGELAMWGETQEERTVIYMGHAVNPDSLESSTLKAAIWDECGMKSVPEDSFATVESRLMVYRGRLCTASRPYWFGWYERLCTIPRPDVQVISFPSWANPFNPPEGDEFYEQKRRTWPAWKFLMRYVGIFTKPAGLIYDCFDWSTDTVDDFNLQSPIWSDAEFYPFLDFGGNNTAALCIMLDRKGDCDYVVGEYYPGKQASYKEHAEGIQRLLSIQAPGKRYRPGCGGNKSGEDGWREAYRMHGIALQEPPFNDVEIGIQAVYTRLASRKLKFFRGAAARTIEQMGSYSRDVDEDGQPTAEIANKAVYHLLDALRAGELFLHPPVRRTAPETGQSTAIEPVDFERDVL